MVNIVKSTESLIVESNIKPFKELNFNELGINLTNKEAEAFKSNLISAVLNLEGIATKDAPLPSPKALASSVYKYFRAGASFDKDARYLYLVRFGTTYQIIPSIYGLIALTNYELEHTNICISHFGSLLLKKDEVVFNSDSMELETNCDIAKKMAENQSPYAESNLKNGKLDELKLPYMLAWITFKDKSTGSCKSVKSIFKLAEIRDNITYALRSNLKGYSNDASPWQTRPFEMFRKTAIKSLLKDKAKIFVAQQYGISLANSYSNEEISTFNNNSDTIMEAGVVVEHAENKVNLDDF